MGKAVVSKEPCRDRRNVRQATKYRFWIRQALPTAIKRRTECTSVWRGSEESCLRCFKASSPTRGCITDSNLHPLFASNKTARILFSWNKIIKTQVVNFRKFFHGQHSAAAVFRIYSGVICFKSQNGLLTALTGVLSGFSSVLKTMS